MTQIILKPTFCDAATGFPAKWRLRNKRRNSILMTCHYPDLSSASDWLRQISHAVWPIRSTIEFWVVPRHQYGISMLVSRGETNGGVANFCLFLQTSFFLFFFFFSAQQRGVGRVWLGKTLFQWLWKQTRKVRESGFRFSSLFLFYSPLGKFFFIQGALK